jgi:hypothetical protein
MSDKLIETIDLLKTQINELAPDFYILDTGEIFEDEHANLEVYPPLTWTNEQCRNLQHQIAAYAADILVDTGYLIPVYVCTPEQQIIEAELTLIRAQQKVQAAEKTLSAAGKLGLYHPLPAQAELVVV